MPFCLEVWHIYEHSLCSSKICQDPIKPWFSHCGPCSVKSWSYVHKITWVHHYSVSEKEADSHGPNERSIWVFGSDVVNLFSRWLVLSKVAGKLDGYEARRGLSEMGTSHFDIGLIPYPGEKLGRYPGLLISRFSSVSHIMVLCIPGSSLIYSAYTLVQATMVFFRWWW